MPNSDYPKYLITTLSIYQIYIPITQETQELFKYLSVKQIEASIQLSIMEQKSGTVLLMKLILTVQLGLLKLAFAVCCYLKTVNFCKIEYDIIF